MNSTSVLKRKKTIDITAQKRSQSEQIINKTTKRKTALKKAIETQCSTATLVKSSSKTKLGTNSKNKKQKSKQKTVSKNSKGKRKSNKMKQNIEENNQFFEKTFKKFLKKNQEKEEQLTERKKIHMEYFMYKDVCLPIENTEQRKIVFKIQLIDENVQRKTKSKECIQSRYDAQKRKSIGEAIKIDTACQKSDRKQEIECQTEYVPQPMQTRNSSDSQPEKCFAQTLSQLQFLYLPDDKNFTNFTKSEKAHYKQLLLYMAKKFDQPQHTLDQLAIQSILNQRYLKQRGITESYPKKGIPTHTSAVLSYVANLFCFLEIHEKSAFIDRINCSYGYSMFQKLSRVKSHKNTQIHSQLISEATFWKFQAQLHDGLQFQEQLVQKALHAHNRAIFDAVNEVLLQFQPYYCSQGQPFPWSYNFQTTFYCISESSYGALVCQVKDKIWQQCTTLAGILLQLENNQPYKLHFTKILSIQQQMLHAELKKYSNRVEVDQSRTRVLCQISNIIQQEIVKEIVCFLFR